MDPNGPIVETESVTVRLADRQRRLRCVHLEQEIGLPEPLDLAWEAGFWQLRFPLPPVDRIEYLFEVVDHNNRRSTIPDPHNPARAPGAFGDKSVLELPGYSAPAWLAGTPVQSVRTDLEVPVLDATMDVTVWAPAGLATDEPAPLVVVHDGPEYDRLGAFTHYIGTAVARAQIPPTRVALLDPGERNAWYSANAGYAAGVATALQDAVVPATLRIGVGVSLGALAMLHLHRLHPGTLDALLLQSGSFFTAEHDGHESEFAGFGAVSAFVDSVHAAQHHAHPVPTVLTCGTVEENLANNRLMAATLHRLGYAARLVERRDAHNYVAWRDALAPALADLIGGVVGDRAA